MLIMHVGHFGGQPDSKMAAKSKRYSDFDETSRKRYDEQISIIEGIDPYTLKKSQLSSEFENFPHITYPDIGNLRNLMFKFIPVDIECTQTSWKSLLYGKVFIWFGWRF